MSIKTRTLILLASLTFFAGPVAAQWAGAESAAAVECAGPVYQVKEVTRRAVLTEKPPLGFSEEARANNATGTIMLSAVLCRDGRVTDIRVVKGMPYGMTERAIEAAQQIRFKPAERDGQAVSQWLRMQYDFKGIGGGGCGGMHVGCSDSLVQAVEIQGNRRQSAEEIFSHVKTRPGDVYDPAQVQRDLQALLELSVFDPAATCVTTTEGARGVVVVFTVKERPIIRDITFEGLESVSEAEVWEALRERLPGLVKESPYDSTRAEHAGRVIRDLLNARGLPNSTVEVRVAEVSSISVVLSFVVGEQR